MVSRALWPYSVYLTTKQNPNHDGPKEKLVTFEKYIQISDMLLDEYFKSGISSSSAYGPRKVRQEVLKYRENRL